jgi:chromosome segregation ATPase
MMEALCLQTGDEGVDMKDNSEDEEVIRLLEQQLQELRSQRAKEQRKVSELEEQLASLLQVQENLNTYCSVQSQVFGCILKCGG